MKKNFLFIFLFFIGISQTFSQSVPLTSICQNGEIYFTGGDGVKTWDFGNGTSTEAEGWHAYASSGSFDVTYDGSLVATVTVSATDNNGLLKMDPPSLQSQTIDCYGGTVKITESLPTGENSFYFEGVTGGPFGTDATFLWHDGVTEGKRSNLTAGTYSVVVTSTAAANSGCKAINVFTIEGPDEGLVLHSVSAPEIKCAGDQSQVEISVTGGTKPYQYGWYTQNDVPSQPTQVKGEVYSTDAEPVLSADITYFLTLEDANGCKLVTNKVMPGKTDLNPFWIDSFSVSSVEPLTINMTKEDILCKGDGLGYLMASVTGGTPAYSYKWESGQTTNELTDISKGTYTIIVTDANACETSASEEINEPDAILEISSFDVTGTILCPDDEIEASAKATGGNTHDDEGYKMAYEYKWNVNEQIEEGSTVNLMPGTYTLTVNDFKGCIATNTFTVTQPEQIEAIEFEDIVCVGEKTDIIMTVTGGTPPLTYQWTGSSSDTTQNIYSVNAGNYTLNITDANECNESFLIKIMESTVSSDFDVYTSKAPEIEFDAAVDDVTYNYYWTFGDYTKSTEINPKHYYESGDGSYDVGLRVIDTKAGCLSETWRKIAFGDFGCSANFSASASGRKVTFTNNSQGDDLLYYWTFGDGNSSSEKSPVYTYKLAGYYDVSLTVTNADGECIDFMTKSIKVSTVKCYAEFKSYIDPNTKEVRFNSLSLGESQYLWFFGDGTTSRQQNPIHTYSADGLYNVKLMIADTSGGTTCADKVVKTLYVGDISDDCNADFSFYVDSTNKATFVPNTIGKNLAYAWNFGDSTATSTDTIATYTYPEAGVYNACLSIMNKNNGNKSINCKKVRVVYTTDYPLANFDYGIGLDGAITFDNNSYHTTSSIWFYGEETDENDTTLYAYTADGYYFAGLKVYGQKTLDFTGEIVKVGDLADEYKAGFVAFPLIADANSESFAVRFIGLSTGEIGNVEWEFETGKTDTTTLSPIYYFSENKTYNVCFTVEDAVTGKSDKYCEDIAVLNTQAPSIKAQVTSLDFLVYPNPFSASATIKYSLENAAQVNLTIFNSLGQKVKTVENSMKPAGEYQVLFSGSDLQQGMYFVKLQAGSQYVVKQVIVK